MVNISAHGIAYARDRTHIKTHYSYNCIHPFGLQRPRIAQPKGSFETKEQQELSFDTTNPSRIIEVLSRSI